MNKADLLKLCVALEQTPRARYECDVWASTYQGASVATSQTERVVAFDALDKKHRFHPAFKRASDQTYGFGYLVVEPTQFCVMSAGAVAATLPEFNASGLVLTDRDKREEDRDPGREWLGRFLPKKFGTSYAHPTFENYTGYTALARFFNIGFNDAIYLFGPLGYYENERNDPGAVAKRIRSYVAHGGKVPIPTGGTAAQQFEGAL